MQSVGIEEVTIWKANEEMLVNRVGAGHCVSVNDIEGALGEVMLESLGKNIAATIERPAIEAVEEKPPDAITPLIV